MTVSDIARMMANADRYRRQGVTQNLPNGSLPPKDHVNPYCPEGMDITGRTDFRRIVPVDEDVANRIRALVFENMKNNGGMSDGEVESQVIKNYIMSLLLKKEPLPDGH